MIPFAPRGEWVAYPPPCTFVVHDEGTLIRRASSPDDDGMTDGFGDGAHDLGRHACILLPSRIAYTAPRCTSYSLRGAWCSMSEPTDGPLDLNPSEIDAYGQKAVVPRSYNTQPETTYFTAHHERYEDINGEVFKQFWRELQLASPRLMGSTNSSTSC